MNNILIGDDVINLDMIESVHRSFVKKQYIDMRWVDVDPPLMTVTVSFPSNPKGENYLSYTGAEAEALWTYLTRHPDIFSLNLEV